MGGLIGGNKPSILGGFVLRNEPSTWRVGGLF
jgi:hypothetical protein